MKSIAEIRSQREQLVGDAQTQRRALAAGFSRLRGPANLVARGLDFFCWLSRNPLLVGVTTAVLVVLRPRRAIKLAGRGLFAWRALRTISGLLKSTGKTP